MRVDVYLPLQLQSEGYLIGIMTTAGGDLAKYSYEDFLSCPLQVQESLQLFQAATCISPLNVYNLKQAWLQHTSISEAPWGRCRTIASSTVPIFGRWRRWDGACTCWASIVELLRRRSSLNSLHQEFQRNIPEVYDEAQKMSPDDWEIWHNKGWMVWKMMLIWHK